MYTARSSCSSGIPNAAASALRDGIRALVEGRFPIERVREIRDEIRSRVLALVVAEGWQRGGRS